MSRKGVRLLILAGLYLLFLIFPLILSNYYIGLLTEVVILTMMGYSFKILFTAGYLTLGIAGFYATGAYVFALFNLHVSKSLFLASVSAIFVSAVLGVGIGLLCVRRQKMYFAVLTLAFSELLRSFFWQWRGVFGGDEGISGVRIPPFVLGPIEISLNSYTSFYYFVLLVLTLCLVLLWKLQNSNFGYVLKAIQANPERMPYIGVNVQRYVIVVFVMSAVLASVAGIFSVCLFGGVNPMAAHIVRTVEPQIATLIGGVTSFGGPLVGSLFYVLAKDYLLIKIGNWLLFIGPLLMALVIVFKSGILGYASEKLHLDL